MMIFQTLIGLYIYSRSMIHDTTTVHHMSPNPQLVQYSTMVIPHLIHEAWHMILQLCMMISNFQLDQYMKYIQTSKTVQNLKNGDRYGSPFNNSFENTWKNLVYLIYLIYLINGCLIAGLHSLCPRIVPNSWIIANVLSLTLFLPPMIPSHGFDGMKTYVLPSTEHVKPFNSRPCPCTRKHVNIPRETEWGWANVYDRTRNASDA